MTVYKSIWLAIFVGIMPQLMDGQEEEWTWFYRKKVSAEELLEIGNRNEISFCKQDCNLFTQLVFSWNALRDQQGYFSFWVRARNYRTGQWSMWHKMIEWGRGVQRSFLSKGTDNFYYAHVRLETGNIDFADAFCIKIMSHDGANFALIKSFAVTLSNYRKFQAEQIDEKGIRFASVRIKSVPKMAQLALDHVRNNHMCSPTSCSMLVSFLMGNRIDPLEFAQKSFDEGLDTYGSWPFNMVHAFEQCNQKFWFAPVRLHSFQRLHACLQQGIPVVVSVRGVLEGAPKIYENGHLLVVVGWDMHKQLVICHDPAFDHADKVVKYYPVKDFLGAWERSYRLSYIADPTMEIIE